MLNANLHRCGADLVGGKHPRRRGRYLGDNHRQISFLTFVAAFTGAEPFYITKQPGRQETLRGNNGTINGMKRLHLGKGGVRKQKEAQRSLSGYVDERTCVSS